MMGVAGNKLDFTGKLSTIDIEDGQTPNSMVVQAGQEDNMDEPFPARIEAGWGHEGHKEQIIPLLGKLAARNAEEALVPIGKAVDELREPLRTVAIYCLYFDNGAEDTARSLGISVEAVEFLSDVALDILACHVNFK